MAGEGLPGPLDAQPSNISMVVNDTKNAIVAERSVDPMDSPCAKRATRESAVRGAVYARLPGFCRVARATSRALPLRDGIRGDPPADNRAPRRSPQASRTARPSPCQI